MIQDIITVVTSVSLVILTIIYKKMQSLMWRFNGVRDARLKAAEASGYNKCVHVQNVIRRNKLTHFSSCNDFDFWTVHEGFAHPNTLLHPSISLYGLTATEAIFVQTTEGVNIYLTDTHPFMKMAQANHAEKIFTMPLEAFHRLADDIGDPKVSVILLSNTGRCGSTLLQSVFEKVPGIIVLGEPDALCFLALNRMHATFTETQRLDLLRSALRVQCKPVPGVQQFLIKDMGITFNMIEDVHSLFPFVKHMFLYRHTIPFVMSMKALAQAGITMRIATCLTESDFIAKLSPMVRKKMCKLFANDKKVVSISGSLCSAGIYCANALIIYTKYQQLVEDGFLVFSVLYEDVVQDKEEIVRKIFNKLDIDEKHVYRALEAFKYDSQRGSSLSRKSTGKRESLSTREISDMNRICDLFDFPDCTNTIELPNRIFPTV